MLEQAELNFDGACYEEEADKQRLMGQVRAIFTYMSSHGWQTLSEIERVLQYPQASISAQLRNLRKERFGGHIIEKRRRGDRSCGLFEYALNKVYNGVDHES